MKRIWNSLAVGVAFCAAAALLLCATRSQTPARTLQQSQRPAETIPAHDHSSAHHRSAKPVDAVLNAIPDVEARDQDGRTLHFYTDLIKGKNVIVNFVFTSCTNICLMQGANYSRIQTALGDRLGKDVYLVSVSIDPVTDTPPRLKSWGGKFGAKPGWTLVTGDKAEVDRLLLSLTGAASGVPEHAGIAFIGNYDRGVWIRADALDDPARLIRQLDDGLRRKIDQ